jgi:hypothetical protein
MPASITSYFEPSLLTDESIRRIGNLFVWTDNVKYANLEPQFFEEGDANTDLVLSWPELFPAISKKIQFFPKCCIDIKKLRSTKK